MIILYYYHYHFIYFYKIGICCWHIQFPGIGMALNDDDKYNLKMWMEFIPHPRQQPIHGLGVSFDNW